MECGHPFGFGRRLRSVGKSPHSNVPCSIWHSVLRQ